MGGLALFAVQQSSVAPQEQVRGQLLVAVDILECQSKRRARILGTSHVRDVLQGRLADEVSCLVDQDSHSLEIAEIQVQRRYVDRVHLGRIRNEVGRRSELLKTL